METTRNHSIMENIGQIALLKEYWRLKISKQKTSSTIWHFKRCQPTKITGICYSCLNEKLFIIEHQENKLLNQRNELISKCKQKNRFKLMNHKTWPLCGKCLYLELFSGANLFPHLDWIWRVSPISPCIHSECGIMWARPIPNANTFQTVDVRTLLCYLNTIVL